MSKQIKQFRYYGENDSKNYPNNIALSNLVTGDVFTNYTPITQLGIQTLPGVKFYLNKRENGAIIVGYTGIYELDLEGIAEINMLSFNDQSINKINELKDAYLIVDIIYEEED